MLDAIEEYIQINNLNLIQFTKDSSIGYGSVQILEQFNGLA